MSERTHREEERKINEKEEEDGEKNSKTRIMINKIKDDGERTNEKRGKNGPFNSFHFIASSFACSRSLRARV